MDENRVWTRETAREQLREVREREAAAWLLAEVAAGLAFGFSAWAAARWPAGVATVGGTGLAAPTFT